MQALLPQYKLKLFIINMYNLFVNKYFTEYRVLVVHVYILQHLIVTWGSRLLAKQNNGTFGGCMYHFKAFLLN